MGLNDDVDEGLSPGEDVLDENPDQPVPEKTTFIMDIANVANQDDVTDEQIFGEGVIKNELPNINAEFVLSNEEFLKVEDLIVIRDELRQSRGICKEDAELIDSQMPGFLSETKPIGFLLKIKQGHS